MAHGHRQVLRARTDLVCALAVLGPSYVRSFRVPLNAASTARAASSTGRWVKLTRWQGSAAGADGRCESLYQRILRAEQSSRTLIGSWNCIGSPEVTEVLADSGMDFVCLDMEHSSMSLETVAHNIRAAQAAMAPPVVRVPGLGPGRNNCKEIMRVLDLGASAVIIPGAQSKEDVEEALAAGMFPRPLAQGGGGGFRGANPFVRAGSHGLEPPSGYHKRSNDEVLVIPLLETPSALENIEDIMRVEGLKVVAFGPFDLSVAMGYDGVRSKEVEDALMRGVQVSKQQSGTTQMSNVFTYCASAAFFAFFMSSSSHEA